MKNIKTFFVKFYKHFILFILFMLLGIYAIDMMINQERERYLDTQTHLFETKYKINYKYFKIMTKDISDMYQDNKQVVNIISQANLADDTKKIQLRNKLYKMLYKKYKRLKNMGISQLQFYTPDNEVFLRMEDKQRYGDNNSRFEDIISIANKTKKPQDGFELDNVTHGFKFTHPLFNKKKFIGTIEISFSSQKLVDSIVDNITHIHFLVSKDEVQKKIIKKLDKNRYEETFESSNYLLETQTHSDFKYSNIHKNIFCDDILKKISFKLNQGNSFSISSTYNYETNIGVFIAIKDIKKQKVLAYLGMFIESDYIDGLIIQEKYIKILYTSIVFLMFLFSIYASLTREKLHNMAHYDELTNLPNRAYFYIQLEQELKRAKRQRKNLAVMFIDLDGFKTINDTYGHNVGDSLLIKVSRRIEKSIREIDIVARLGGDEFTVVLLDLQRDEDSIEVANKIIAALNKKFIINSKSINIGASIGISTFPKYASDSDTIIKQSDNAMYIAKENGKNRVIIHKG
jgi:diguanylate cyclase (GGDEF)-like protein